MASGLNKIILIGNLGQDPEIRHTNQGTAMANLRIAVSYRKKDSSGNWGDETEWFTVVVWNSTAENCAKYLKKGRQVYVEGRMQSRKWEAKDGTQKTSWEVIASDVKFLGSDHKQDGQQQQPQQSQQPQQGQQPAQQEANINWQQPDQGGYNQNYKPANNYGDNDYGR
jgi:single-strand DNA-binding protein